jgi:hypothetical protein
MNVIVFDEEDFKKFVAKCDFLRYLNGDNCFEYEDRHSDDTPHIYPIAIINKETYEKRMEKRSKWIKW